MILYDTERSTYSYSMHADNLKGCTRVRQRICEHKESTIKSIGQELVELMLVLLVLRFRLAAFWWVTILHSASWQDPQIVFAKTLARLSVGSVGR